MRAAFLPLGLLVLAACWLSSPIGLLPRSFSLHMAMHMGVVALAAPLIAFGVAGGKLDPVGKAPRIFLPIPASVVELIVVWTWHAPALHESTQHSAVALVLEQGSFLASSLWVWLSAFGGTPRERNDRGAAGVVALLLTSMHMTLLGALLALPPRPLYAHSAHGGGTSLAPLTDQHLGGAIMLLGGGVSYLLGGLLLTAELLRSARTASEPS
jgi:putative membrane protein